MLLEFRVSNYRSFRDEQTFSMLAYPRHEEGLNTHAFATGVENIPPVLKTAAIYGANASGKSNLLKAIQFMRSFVIQTVTNPSPVLNAAFSPFLFDDDSVNKPSSFEISILLNSVRYQYGFSILKGRVLEEYLLAYPQKVAQTWFSRTWNSQTEQYEYSYSTFFKGSKKTWEKMTRDTALYLSTAVALNNIQLKPIYDWFKDQLVVINDLERLNQNFTVNQIKVGKAKDEIINLLQSADFSIDDIHLLTKKVPGKNITFNGDDQVQVTDQELEQDFVSLGHETDSGVRFLNLEQESLGTQKFFFLAGPILDILTKHVTILFDELDSSLHPKLVEKLIQAFETFPNQKEGSQLIFTTHCDGLLENQTSSPKQIPLLRRDQVWFISKSSSQFSKVYSLLDFKVRKNESVREGYRKGRFDAIPLIDQLFKAE